tara:strand:+ start:10177 stop:10524 length:348 start_codon:yes stop_codon:yes gene_type:complete
MTEEIINYFLGAIIVSNLIVCWNYTNLPVHFYDIKNFFNKKKEKFYTRDDWEQHVALNCGTLGELIMCPLCLATHLSWITGLCIHLITECTPWIILYGAFSWPLISFIFYKKLDS